MVRKGLLWLGLAALTSGCLGSADGQKVSDAQAHFYDLLAQKAYSQIYVEAAPEVQSSITSDGFVAFMQDFDNRLGACQPAKKKLDIKTNATDKGFFQDQGYTQVCANGTAEETLTIVVRDGVAKVAGWKFTT